MPYTKKSLNLLTREELLTTPDSVIAEEYGVSRQAVYQRRKRMGVPSPLGRVDTSVLRFVTDEEWSSLSNRQVAEAYGVTKATALRYRSEKGKPASPFKRGQTGETGRSVFFGVTDEEWASLSNPQIAELVGLTTKSAVTQAAMYRSKHKKPKSPLFTWGEGVGREAFEAAVESRTTTENLAGQEETAGESVVNEGEGEGVE